MAIKKNRNVAIKERNKKIKDMDMEEVKHYLCMKNNQNPDKCPGCLGLSTCAAGQRVMVLMNEREKRKAEEEKAANARKIGIAQRSWRREKSEEYIRKALASEDPREFLMREEGLDSNKARKKLENWKRNHPDLFIGVTWPVAHAGTNHHMKKKEQEVMKEPEIAAEIKPTANEAEVSVEEFLNAVHANDIVDAVNTDTVTEEADAELNAVNACGIPKKLLAKESQICEEMGRIEKQIRDLQERYNMLKKARNAVSQTMSLLSSDKLTNAFLEKELRFVKGE